jgi:hypothetical protein
MLQLKLPKRMPRAHEIACSNHATLTNSFILSILWMSSSRAEPGPHKGRDASSILAASANGRLLTAASRGPRSA